MRQHVHDQRLDRQHDRAEGQEQQHERRRHHHQRHPRQQRAEALEQVGQHRALPADEHLAARRRRHVADLVDQRPRLLGDRVAVVGDPPRGRCSRPRRSPSRRPPPGRRPPRRRTTAGPRRPRGSRRRRAASRRPRSGRTGPRGSPRGSSRRRPGSRCRPAAPARRCRRTAPAGTAAPARPARPTDGDGEDDRPAHHAVRDPVPGAGVLVGGAPTGRAEHAGAATAAPTARRPSGRASPAAPAAGSARRASPPGRRSSRRSPSSAGTPAGRSAGRPARSATVTPGDRHRAAGRGHGAGQRGLDVRLPADLLAEPADHEQAVVDGQAQADDRDDVDGEDRDVGDHRRTRAAR